MSSGSFEDGSTSIFFASSAPFKDGLCAVFGHKTAMIRCKEEGEDEK